MRPNGIPTWFFTLVCCVGLSAQVHSQTDYCSSPILTDRNIVSAYTKDTVTYALCNDPDCPTQAPPLVMNVYKPTVMVQGVAMPARFPLMLLLPGGGYLNGDNEMAQWPEEFVKKGMIVATIDYRKGWDANGDGVIDDLDMSFENPGDCVGDFPTLFRAVIRSTVDARTSVRFLLGDSINYPIDKRAMFCGGPSAGASLAAHLGYGRPGELEELWTRLLGADVPLMQSPCDMRYDPIPCSPPDGSTYYQGDFSFRGVMSCWGQLTGLTTMDPNPGPDPGDTTPDSTGLIAFYGGRDHIFPPDIGPTYNCPNLAVGMGGLAMFNERRQYGYPAQLYLDPTALHKFVWLDENLDPGPARTRDRLDRIQFIAARTACFFKSILCGQPCSFNEAMEMENTEDWVDAYYSMYGTENGRPVGCRNDGSTRFSSTDLHPMAYPNPTTGRLWIADSGFSNGGEYEISDLMGRVVFQGRFKKEDSSFDLRKLPNGMYFLRLDDGIRQEVLRVTLQRHKD